MRRQGQVIKARAAAARICMVERRWDNQLRQLDILGFLDRGGGPDPKARHGGSLGPGNFPELFGGHGRRIGACSTTAHRATLEGGKPWDAERPAGLVARGVEEMGRQ